MIGLMLEFQYGTDFSGARLRELAASFSARFQGMPGLRSKSFTIATARRAAINFYVWESEEAARSFLTPTLLERVTALYGVRPLVQFVDVAALVDNGAGVGAPSRPVDRQHSSASA